MFGLQDILDLLERRPEIYSINSGYAGVNWYRHHLDELRTVGAEQTKQL
jgi:spore coat polysaccharide biosynthesis protein SpsF